MAKQSRRKNNKGNKGKNNKPEEVHGSIFLQRLRHADSKTRHAALAALLSTRLNPEELEAKSHKKGKDDILVILQAVRERVMDTDLECAQVAAGCLANYVTFGTPNNNDEDMESTAGWTIVLVTRLQECCERLKDTAASNHKQWWALTVQCLHASCGLVESNELALERWSNMEIDAVAVFLNVLQLAQQNLVQLQATTNAIIDTDDQLQSMIQDVCICATRTLHSALDDNLQLYQRWSSGWDVFTTILQNSFIPMAARLHAAGCLVAASQVSQDPNMQHIVVTTVLPRLYQCLEFHPDISKALLEKYTTSLAQFKDEQADEQVEKDVIRKVNERKEPAREIARRQKELKEQKKKLKDDDKDEDDIMKNNDDESNNQAMVDHENRREAMEHARRTWHSSLLPLQLALEITVNLTSVGPSQDILDEEDMVVDDEWSSDKEAQLMQPQQQTDHLSPLEHSLMQSIVESGIPTRVVQLLHLVCTPLGLTADVELPAEVKQELEQLQSKCGACLSNCLAEHFPWWGAKWTDLRVAFEETGGTEAVADTMTVALRSKSQVRKQIQPQDLDFMLTYLTRENTVTTVQRNVVEMLGVLCSKETHPVQVNLRVSTALMSVPIKSVSIVNEVLNALMDTYAEDDCHPEVFSSLQVLGYFQKTIPLFKKLIELERSKSSKEEVEQWRESALNASRFVSYKKGQR